MARVGSTKLPPDLQINVHSSTLLPTPNTHMNVHTTIYKATIILETSKYRIYLWNKRGNQATVLSL